MRSAAYRRAVLAAACACATGLLAACGARAAEPVPVLRFQGTSVKTLAWWPSQTAAAVADYGTGVLPPARAVRRGTGLRLTQVVVDESVTGGKTINWVFGRYDATDLQGHRWVTVQESSTSDYPPGPAAQPSGMVQGSPGFAFAVVGDLNVSVACDDRTDDALGILQALVIQGG